MDFMPLGPTDFHQMTGRAGRRGMDEIGFAAVLPGRYMDARLMAKLVGVTAADVSSQIRINFSMTLNLLLSHTVDQIETLLQRSLASFELDQQMKQRKPGSGENRASRALWADFIKHYDFLKETGYVSEDGRLSEDGIWASQLRVDQPLMIAEGFRQQVFPQSDPVMLAAVVACFVNDRENDDHIGNDRIPNSLKKTFLKIIRGLQSFKCLMADRGFDSRPLFIRPALALFLWTTGLTSWEDVTRITGIAEGDLAMLILRTADHLRHIAGLKKVFPQAAETAHRAIDQMLRDPVVAVYEE
jgi:superfamily II RNA helicase